MFTADQSREEAKANGQKGGKASGEARRKKKALREIAQMMMDRPVLGTDRKRLLESGIKEEDLNNQWVLLTQGLIGKAMQGDVKAFTKIQELADQQTNTLIEIRKQELELKRRELELKEKELELRLNQGGDDEKVIIVHDLEDLDEQDS